jgi:hypothetical protein
MNRNPDDGTFFMQFEDMFKEFDQYDICMVNDNYKYDFVRAQCTKKRGKLF